MKISVKKAIEVLEDMIAWEEPGDSPEEYQAMKLGIEALRRIEELRGKGYQETEVGVSSEREAGK